MTDPTGEVDRSNLAIELSIAAGNGTSILDMDQFDASISGCVGERAQEILNLLEPVVERHER